jgi:hypothetical protein
VLAAVARVNAEVAITVYALDEGKRMPSGLVEPGIDEP